MRGAYRSGGIKPALASAARARISAASSSMTGADPSAAGGFPAAAASRDFPACMVTFTGRAAGPGFARESRAGAAPVMREGAGARAGMASVTNVTAQLAHAAPRTVHRSQSMIMSISWWVVGRFGWSVASVLGRFGLAGWSVASVASVAVGNSLQYGQRPR